LGGEDGLERSPAPLIRPTRRVGAGDSEQIEGDKVGRRFVSGPDRTGAPTLEPILQPLKREPAVLPHDEFTVQSGRSGSCPPPVTTSGNAGPISVPRLERSTTFPASTETSARNPSHFNSAAHPGRRRGSGTGALSIGSGSVHVTHHAFHRDRRPFECSDLSVATSCSSLP
jgi:hypothetical protein